MEKKIGKTTETREITENKQAKEYVVKFDKEFLVQLAIIGVLALLLIYNFGKSGGTTGSVVSTGISKVSASEIIPTGVPKIYGKELNVRYDDIDPNDPRKADAIISVLGNFDDAITLTGNDLQRYIDVASQISCEYCCGAEAIIFKNGEAACGCAHSYAMRGLAKYLLKNHGNEFSDDEVLSELGKWKVLFFPGIHENKAGILKQQGIELNYINLASNKYRGIEQGQQASGEMVGGC